MIKDKIKDFAKRHQEGFIEDAKMRGLSFCDKLADIKDVIHKHYTIFKYALSQEKINAKDSLGKLNIHFLGKWCCP